MRYQTSSISRKAKPTSAAANGGSHPGHGAGSEAASSAGSAAASPVSLGSSRARLRAASTTRRLSRAAIQMVLRIPTVSRSQKVVRSAPSTAPRVLTA